jgi:hypothetical protein
MVIYNFSRASLFIVILAVAVVTGFRGNRHPDMVIRCFWKASLFIGILTAIIIGFQGNWHSDWIFAIIVGGLVFLACGFISQGIITLLKKSE